MAEDPTKVVVVGVKSRTRLVHAFIYKDWHPAFEEEPQVSDDTHYRKTIEVNGEDVIVEVLDTAGQEEYSALRDQYCRAGHGALLVYSVTSRSSFEEVPQLREQFLRVREEESFPVVLVGIDVEHAEERQVSLEEAQALATLWNAPAIESDCRYGPSANMPFALLTQEIRRYAAIRAAAKPTKVAPSKPRGLFAAVKSLLKKDKPAPSATPAPPPSYSVASPPSGSKKSADSSMSSSKPTTEAAKSDSLSKPAAVSSSPAPPPRPVEPIAPPSPSPVKSMWSPATTTPDHQPTETGQKLNVGLLDSNFSFSGVSQNNSSTPTSSNPNAATVRGAVTSSGTIDLSQVRQEKLIGRGSFGDVWKGTWHGTDVAVKSVLANTEKMKEAVLREVSIMQNMRHPNCVALLGYAWTETEEVKLVMEYLAGGSLDKVLHNPAFKLTWGQARRMALDVAKGMAFLHAHNPPVIHRDLKSLNLLVDDHGNVKVCDFGLGRVVGQTATQTNRVGTFLWQAPELMNEEPYGLPVDVYAFGIVMSEICARHFPYEGMGDAKIVMGVSSGKLRPTVPDQLPPAWTSLMKRCWAGTPSDRPPFSDIVQELKDMSLPEDDPIVIL